MKKTAPVNLRRTLERISFFSGYSDEDLSRIEEIIIHRRYNKNTVILMEDETKNYMYIVFSGKVKVMQMGLEGKEQIVAIHSKGDFFGEMELLDGKTQPATVIALEDTTVGLIVKNDFEKYFLESENVQKKIISLLCRRLRESWLMLRILSFNDAEQRLRALLRHIASIYGVKDIRGIVIPLKLTHKEISDYTALARETVSRLLSRLCQKEEIEILDNKNIILKPLFLKRSGDC
jgi:CRP/FNR family transcriptional regulator